MNRRVLLKPTLALALGAGIGTARAQSTPVKCQLDGRFEGPAALFLTAWAHRGSQGR